MTDRQLHILRMLADPCSAKGSPSHADRSAVQAALDELDRIRPVIAAAKKVVNIPAPPDVLKLNSPLSHALLDLAFTLDGFEEADAPRRAERSE